MNPFLSIGSAALLACSLCASAAPAGNGGVPGAVGATVDAERYFSKESIRLTPQESAALAIGKRWDAGAAAMPLPGPDGTVKFVFGAQTPSIVCAVLQVCDVALQAGEQVNSISLGDTVRWSVEPAIAGTGINEVQHLVIKPLDVGLSTSLIVTTNRRTYHLRLRSHRTEFMSQVAFSYPEEAQAKWDALQKREARTRQEKAEKVLPATGQSLEELSFDYDVTGNASWKPVRVYNDGKRTTIEMPPSMQQTDAPTLLVVRKEGSLFSDEDTAIVNYRLQNNRYIVDSIFDRAILVSGVGRNQDRITITRRK